MRSAIPYMILTIAFSSCGVKTTTKKTTPIIKEAVVSKSVQTEPLGPQFFQDEKATPWFSKSNRCQTMRERTTCPTESKQSLDVGIDETSDVTDCSVWCRKPDGAAHGPYERITIKGYAAGEFERGTYTNNHLTGRWVRGVTRCQGESCSESLLSESTYDPKLGLIGENRQWYESGQISRKETWVNGVLDGAVEEFWENGKPRLKARYVANKLEGTYESWHHNGQLLMRVAYRNGVSEGEWKEFAVDGKLLSDGRYQKGKKIGQWKTWHTNGTIRAEEVFDKQGRRDGRFCYWRDNGSLIKCFEMRHGTGRVFEFDIRGSALREYELLNDQLHGKDVSFGFEGQVISESRHENNQLHGESRAWDATGKLTSIYTYDRGVLHGRSFTQYWDRDHVSGWSEGTYCQGYRCGHWRFDSPEGKREQAFEKNEVMLWDRQWDKTGNLISEWPSSDATDPYERCLFALTKNGCCFREQNPPEGAKICDSNSKSGPTW